jgi:dihydrofolate reductase/thymidylate synthase
MARSFNIIVACSKNKGIGKDGVLPWKIPDDMRHFKEITLSGSIENTVIMGRKTWESIPAKFKPLAGRKNIVISSSLKSDSCTVVRSLSEALENSVGLVFIIGGALLFEAALSAAYLGLCEQIYLTRISHPFDCDVFFPSEAGDIFNENFLPDFSIVNVSKTRSLNSVPYDFVVYQRKSSPWHGILTSYQEHEEYQYLKCVAEIMKEPSVKADRTHVGTYSLFGKMFRYDLQDSFPLFTTKLVFWRGIVEELLWFIKGSTSSIELSSKGIHFWDANGSRQFLDNLGLQSREEGDLGPVYGFQWRHFGAEYVDFHQDYSGQGVDQLAEVVRLLRTDPDSRRIILSAWNPKSQPLMALPPCHVLSQFYVKNKKLSCIMFQRAGDMGLGVPFNVGSYSLLTCLLAQVAGLERGEFVHVIGDTHVYSNHVGPLQEQIKRHPFPFPVLELNPLVQEIERFTPEDIKLHCYLKHGKIKMDMAV